MHQVHPSAQQVPGAAHALGVGVGHGQHPSAQKGRDLLGIDLHEGDPFPATQIGDPVPGEDAFHRHDDVGPVRGDGFQEGIRVCGQVLVQEDLSALVHDAEVHDSCVQVDPAIECMLTGVESHKASSLG